MKLCYLADIFQLLNELNLSIQGTYKTMSDSYNKIEGQKKKKLWIQRVENNHFDMFSGLTDQMVEAKNRNQYYNSNKLVIIIVNHLKTLSIKFEEYFPVSQDPRTETLWVLDPFNFTRKRNKLSIVEEDLLADLSSDVTLKNVKENSSLDKFWIQINGEYKDLSDKAIQTILPFPSTYLCESGFSTETLTKTKQRNRLNLTAIVRLSLTNLTPNIEDLCK